MEFAPTETPFDKKFIPQTTELFSSKVRSVDIKPEFVKLDKQTPLVFAPGWSGGVEPYKGSLRMLSQAGRHVLSIDQPRYGGNVQESYAIYRDMIAKTSRDSGSSEDSVKQQGEQMDKRWKFLSEHIAEATLRRSLMLLGFLESKGIDKADMVGHSEGGIDAAVAKVLNPGRVGNLVLVDSGGLIGEISTLDLIKQNGKQVKIDSKGLGPVRHDITGQESVEQRTSIIEGNHKLSLDAQRAEDIRQLTKDQFSPTRSAKNVARYFLSNPKRAIAETRAIAHADINTLLEIARADGSKVGIIHAVDDATFPMEHVQTSGAVVADKLDAQGNTKRGTVDGFISVLGTHNTLGVEPRYMSWVDNLLTNFTRQQKEKNARLTP